VNDDDNIVGDRGGRVDKGFTIVPQSEVVLVNVSDVTKHDSTAMLTRSPAFPSTVM